MHPDWLGSPQHAAGGAALAFAVVLAGRRLGAAWLAALVAIGVTATTEILIELVEYPLLYAHVRHVTAYYDTLADMAGTLAGAVVGVAVGLAVRARRTHRV